MVDPHNSAFRGMIYAFLGSIFAWALFAATLWLVLVHMG